MNNVLTGGIYSRGFIPVPLSYSFQHNCDSLSVTVSVSASTATAIRTYSFSATVAEGTCTESGPHSYNATRVSRNYVDSADGTVSHTTISSVAAIPQYSLSATVATGTVRAGTPTVTALQYPYLSPVASGGTVSAPSSTVKVGFSFSPSAASGTVAANTATRKYSYRCTLFNHEIPEVIGTSGSASVVAQTNPGTISVSASTGTASHTAATLKRAYSHSASIASGSVSAPTATYASQIGASHSASIGAVVGVVGSSSVVAHKTIVQEASTGTASHSAHTGSTSRIVLHNATASAGACAHSAHSVTAIRNVSISASVASGTCSTSAAAFDSGALSPAPFHAIELQALLTTSISAGTVTAPTPTIKRAYAFVASAGVVTGAAGTPAIWHHGDSVHTFVASRGYASHRSPRVIAYQSSQAPITELELQETSP